MVNYTLVGLIYGLTAQNHLVEIEACYKGASTIDKEIMVSVHLFKAGGWDNIT